MKKYGLVPINKQTKIYSDLTEQHEFIHLGKMKDLIFEEHDSDDCKLNKTMMLPSIKFIGCDFVEFLKQIQYQRSKDYFVDIKNIHLQETKLFSLNFKELNFASTIAGDAETLQAMEENAQSWLKNNALGVVFNKKKYNLKAITKSRELVQHITSSSHHILMQFFNEHSELISVHIQDLNKADNGAEYLKLRIFKNVMHKAKEVLIHSEEIEFKCENIHRYPLISLFNKSLTQEDFSPLPDSFIANSVSGNSILLDKENETSFMEKMTLPFIIQAMYKKFKIRPFNLYITDKTYNEEWKIIPYSNLKLLNGREWILNISKANP